MWITNENSDPFHNTIKIEDEEYTYPWNNDQLNFDIICDISTNKEKESDIEIIIPNEIFSDEEEKNNTHNEKGNGNGNGNVILLIKKDLNNENEKENFKKKRDK